MSKISDKKRIGELRDLLHQANRAYFVHFDPIMSDTDYDSLLRELIELEQTNPEFDDPNSPTKRVGGKPIAGFKSVRHRVPMMSIDNTYDVDDLRAWHERVVKGIEGDGPTYVCDPKVDGVAVSLRYEHGELAVAVRRGDGERGDDITAQVQTIRSIPLRLEIKRPPPSPRLARTRGQGHRR